MALEMITKNSRETQKVAGLLARQFLAERASFSRRAPYINPAVELSVHYGTSLRQNTERSVASEASGAPHCRLRRLVRGCITGRAAVLALQGDLGAGKTTFIQGFAKGLGIKEKILSPTFVILKRFNIPKSHSVNKLFSHSISKSLNHSTTQSLKYFYHIDCYRIDNPREIIDLGFKEIAADPRNVVVIEWAERIKKILPKSAIWLDFEWLDKNKRKITIVHKARKV